MPCSCVIRARRLSLVSLVAVALCIVGCTTCKPARRAKGTKGPGSPARLWKPGETPEPWINWGINVLTTSVRLVVDLTGKRDPSA